MIKTLLTSLTGKFGIYLLVAAVAGGGIYVFIQEGRIKNLSEDLNTAVQKVGRLETQVATQTQTISTMERQYNETIRGTRQLNAEVSRLREEQNEIEAQYNEYRGRLAKLSAKKPGLVERLANNAFADVLRNFTEVTTRPGNSDEQSDTDTGTSGQTNNAEDR
jgi:septal ring factor EnvC (AmiA/AmiB activator)